MLTVVCLMSVGDTDFSLPATDINFPIAIHLATYRGERTLAIIVEFAIQINNSLQVVHKRHLHIFFRKRMQILKALICIRDYSIFSTFFSKDFHKHIIIRTQ